MMSRRLQPVQDTLDPISNVKTSNNALRRISSYDPYEELHAQLHAHVKESLSPTKRHNGHTPIFSHSHDTEDDQEQLLVAQSDDEQGPDELQWEGDDEKSSTHEEEELLSFRTDLIMLEDSSEADALPQPPTFIHQSMPHAVQSLDNHSLLLIHHQPQSMTNVPYLETFHQHIPGPTNYEDMFRQHLSYAESRTNMELLYLSTISHTRQEAVAHGLDGVIRAPTGFGSGLDGFMSNLIREQLARLHGGNGNDLGSSSIDGNGENIEVSIDDIPAACEYHHDPNPGLGE
ncbi:hypothetical protein SeLEV6574_g00645 [Synchytrium endobioticum]|nr:hypothetical protein SeLEV6574_g00645 [Synchytrium endobioticum]